MVVAAWTHKGRFFVFKDGWEYNLILGLLAVLIATIGPGRWSLDYALDLTDDLSGGTGLVLSLLGIVAAVVLLAVFWKPVPQVEPEA
jgi:putative oxidoreductase